MNRRLEAIRGSVGHDLGMKTRVHPKYKTKYRVKNWCLFSILIRDLC